MELLQNINASLRMLCSFVFSANKKIMVDIMRSTKNKCNGGYYEKIYGYSNSSGFWSWDFHNIC